MEILGREARDKITGFQGVITAKIQYLYGCAQYSLTSPAKDGELKEGQWFDEGRIEIVGDGVRAEDVKAERNGGYHPENPKVY